MWLQIPFEAIVVIQVQHNPLALVLSCIAEGIAEVQLPVGVRPGMMCAPLVGLGSGHLDMESSKQLPLVGLYSDYHHPHTARRGLRL